MGERRVREFGREWERVLKREGVPEPDLSVRFILEHVLQWWGGVAREEVCVPVCDMR